MVGIKNAADLLRPNIDDLSGSIHGWAGSTVDHLNQCLSLIRLGIHDLLQYTEPNFLWDAYALHGTRH